MTPLTPAELAVYIRGRIDFLTTRHGFTTDDAIFYIVEDDFIPAAVIFSAIPSAADDRTRT